MKEWECGDALIDEQHRKLLVISNELIQQLQTDPAAESTLELLDDLLDHIVQHFRDEERILGDAGYPDVAGHADIHAGLVAKARHLRESYLKGELRTSAFFSFIIDDVVMGHMLTEDTKFFPYVRKVVDSKDPVFS